MAEDEHVSQRMPEELLSDLDDFATDMGISRNGAINLLVAQGLREEGYREAPRRGSLPRWPGVFGRNRDGGD